MGTPHYDIDELRAAYDATAPQPTAAAFWAAVAERLGRSAHGVRNRCARVEHWQPKVTRPTPCAMCGERCTWDRFGAGGRVRVCLACTASAVGGQR